MTNKWLPKQPDTNSPNHKENYVSNILAVTSAAAKAPIFMKFYTVVNYYLVSLCLKFMKIHI